MNAALTLKQRNKAYRFAQKLIIDLDKTWGCHALEAALFTLFEINTDLYDYNIKKYFPEFYLFSPFKDAHAYWDAEERQARIIAFELCIQMTKKN